MESALTNSAPVARANRRASADLPLAVGPAISQMRGAMELVLTLVAPPNAGAFAINLREVCACAGAKGTESRKLSTGDGAATDVILEAEDRGAGKAALEPARAEQALDWCLQPLEGRRKALLVADMDSTIIGWTQRSTGSSATARSASARRRTTSAPSICLSMALGPR